MLATNLLPRLWGTVVSKFNLTTFQQQVDEKIRERSSQKQGLTLGPKLTSKSKLKFEADLYFEVSKSDPPSSGPDDKIAKDLLDSTEVKKNLCPLLKNFTGDVYNMSQITTPNLASLALAGKISVPLTPGVFASIAIAISKMGVDILCPMNRIEHDKEVLSRKAQ
jgi:hypothetical protein